MALNTSNTFPNFSCVRKASKLASSVNNDEAWDSMNRIMEEYPNKLLNLLQEQLSPFLNLPFDQFDHSVWPLKSRIDPPLLLNDDDVISKVAEEPSMAKRRKLQPPSSLNLKLVLSGRNSLEKGFYYTLADNLLDYMVSQKYIYETEGLFRRNGSVNRIKSSLNKFVKILQENQVKLLGQRCISVRQQLFDAFAQCTSYDLAGCLMKSLAKCVKNQHTSSEQNFIPRVVVDLMNKATELQYNLKTPLFSRNQDWEHCLCRARQLLTYRICLNFLLPEPESRLLSKLLQLLNLVAENEVESRMNFTSLGTCLAVLLCGADSTIKMGKEREAMKLGIDTLANLIRYYPELKAIPGFLLTEVKNFLRSQMTIQNDKGSSFTRSSTPRQNMFANWRRQKSSVQVNSMMEKAPNSFLRRMKMPRSQSSLAIKRGSMIFD